MDNSIMTEQVLPVITRCANALERIAHALDGNTVEGLADRDRHVARRVKNSILLRIDNGKISNEIHDMDVETLIHG
jgi:hypothetical protein